MTTWNYINIVLCFLLLVFLCWNEWRRTKKARLGLRLGASILAVGALAFLIVPVNRTVTENTGKGSEVVLLTEGFIQDSLDHFLKEKTGVPVFAFDKAIIISEKKHQVHYLDISDLLLLSKQGDLIHIFGYGLDQDELEKLHGNHMIFHPSKAKEGIAAINWQHHLKSGDRLQVQGQFVNNSSSQIILILSGDGAGLDTALIPAGRNVEFELAAVPKQIGKAVYAVAALRGKDTLEKEDIPFETKQPGNLKILVLAASPDFENKFLKAWITGNNSSLVSRTTISRDKYEKTFSNTEMATMGAINNTLLNNFDLLIADASELASIGKAELAAIESQVAQKGMGLIVKADSTSSKRYFFSSPFPLHPHPDNYKKELSVFIPATNGYAAALISEHPLYIHREPGTKTLIEDRESNAVVSGTIYGSGKIIFTTVNSTYSWMLSGDTKNYAAYWSYLLGEATAKTGVESAWKVSPQFPVVNRAVDIQYASNAGEIPQVQVGGEFMYMAQDADLPFQWSGRYWPRQSGWQPIVQEGKAGAWWYAYGPDD
ncbi:MAG: hypothetical protein ABI151_00395, partial [Chitinophagaceae bacterium]